MVIEARRMERRDNLMATTIRWSNTGRSGDVDILVPVGFLVHCRAMLPVTCTNT